MLSARFGKVLAVLAALGVSGCVDKGLRTLTSNSAGPDEFILTPSKHLEKPQDYAFLPAPTPGASNRVDQKPNSEAVEAVGGNPAKLDPNAPIPGSDAALVTAASRGGVSPDIRVTLSAQDAKFRKRQSRLSSIRLFKVDRYEQAYRKQALDPFEVAVPYRRAGFPTPSAPPYD